MANEWALRVKTSDPFDFTVTNATGIEKGTLCKMTDPRTAIISSAAGDMCAGVSASEKIASDGRTSLGFYREGIFDVNASGAISVGQPIISAGNANNEVMLATPAYSGAAILGYALETAADDETFQMYLNIGAGGNN